jgi:hypothetical protein
VILDIVGPLAGRLAAVLFLARNALDPILTHQKGKSVQAALLALVTQALSDVTGTSDAITLGMKYADAFQQALILFCTRAHRTITPAVIAAR